MLCACSHTRVFSQSHPALGAARAKPSRGCALRRPLVCMVDWRYWTDWRSITASVIYDIPDDI